jgi:hypothetical protein
MPDAECPRIRDDRVRIWSECTCAGGAGSAAAGEAGGGGEGLTLVEQGGHTSQAHAPMTTLFALERTIQQRREEAAASGEAGAYVSLCMAFKACMCVVTGGGQMKHGREACMCVVTGGGR